MTTIHRIQARHLNENSILYGGQLLEWIDNYCSAKTERYKKIGDNFVTRATNCEFILPVFLGDMIKLKIRKEIIKHTSITFDYEVISNRKIVAKGSSTFVKINNGKPTLIMKNKKIKCGVCKKLVKQDEYNEHAGICKLCVKKAKCGTL